MIKKKHCKKSQKQKQYFKKPNEIQTLTRTDNLPKTSISIY